MELGVGRTPNNLFPTWSPAPENKSFSFTLLLGLYPGSLNALAKTTTYTQAGLCSAHTGKLKIALPPSGPVIGGGTAGFDKQESSVLWPAAICFH